MEKYTVFVRNFYKLQTNEWTGVKKLVPDPGARRTKLLDYEVDEETARAYCKKWNAEHKPGPFSRKAEYTSDY